MYLFNLFVENEREPARNASAWRKCLFQKILLCCVVCGLYSEFRIRVPDFSSIRSHSFSDERRACCCCFFCRFCYLLFGGSLDIWLYLQHTVHFHTSMYTLSYQYVVVYVDVEASRIQSCQANSASTDNVLTVSIWAQSNERTWRHWTYYMQWVCASHFVHKWKILFWICDLDSLSIQSHDWLTAIFISLISFLSFQFLSNIRVTSLFRILHQVHAAECADSFAGHSFRFFRQNPILIFSQFEFYWLIVAHEASEVMCVRKAGCVHK